MTTKAGQEDALPSILPSPSPYPLYEWRGGIIYEQI